MEGNTISTIGHSTRTTEEFLDLLHAYAIQLLVDVRAIPRSRAHPQLGSDLLPFACHPIGIEYHHLKALGGLRHTTKVSPNTGWRNASFRGFADDMATPAFGAGLAELEDKARRKTSRSCVPKLFASRCHRRLLADALIVAGWHVYHIMSKHTTKEHTLTHFCVWKAEC